MLNADEILIRAMLEAGVVEDDDVERAKAHARTAGVTTPDALIELKLATSRDVAIARATISECPFVDVDAFEVEISHASMLPRSAAERYGAFPLFVVEDLVTVGMLDPLNLRAVDQVRQLLKSEVDVALCESEPLRRLIARAYSLAGDERRATGEDEAEQGELTTGDEPIVRAVNQIIASAIDEAASDIHVCPDETELMLRYRIDGALQRKQGPPLSAHSGIVQRLKVMANLDLTQTRRPQDGKFRFDHRGQRVEVRLSTIPTVCGENVVMRLLRPHAAIRDLADLGMCEADSAVFEEAVRTPHGMILVTGPTGSGKTTTLYTALSMLNGPDRNIMTIEDPVEIRLPMVRQTQANPDVGLTFASALRSILRQDPDVVLVGEIRDEETAHIAMQASLTGHLVLSTLHTNDAVGAVARLRDFGTPAFALNSSLLLVVAQRLVRKNCERCVTRCMPTPEMLARFGLGAADADGLRRGEGCGKCMGTGYRGRQGVYELLKITPEVQRAIDLDEGPVPIREAAVRGGMRPMWRDGLERALQGVTTLEELGKVVATIELESSGEAKPEVRMSA